MKRSVIMRKGTAMDFTMHYESPLGGMTMASDGEVLTGLWFDGRKYSAAPPPAGHPERDLTAFDETVRWLDFYFSGKAPDFIPAMEMRTTAFRKMVWEILLTIPYGRTTTYGQIAERIAKQTSVRRMSAQAVGGAVGHNAFALIVPCHRVVGADGSLTGYAGGIDKKLKLLRMEGADLRINDDRGIGSWTATGI